MIGEDQDGPVEVLHAVLMPRGTPVLPTLDLAAHFSVAPDPGEAGGAWWDVVHLPSGRVALVVGQVPGTGLPAAAAAAALASVLRAGLVRDEDAAAAVQLADLYAARTPDARDATAIVVVVDDVAGELTWVTAGDVAPLLASAQGPSRTLAATGHGALGSGHAGDAGRQHFATGDLALLAASAELTTEGLDRPETTDLLDAARVAGDAVATCEALAQRAAAWQTRGALTFVAVEARPAPVAPLEVELDVDDATTTRARQALQGWLRELRTPFMDGLALVHAAMELVSNVQDHAYPDDAGERAMVLRAEHGGDGTVVVDVADHGRWRAGSADPDTDRGRGLAMAAGLVDDLAVTIHDGGTRVRLRHRLTRPVLADRPAASTRRVVEESLRIEPLELGVVRLSGNLRHDDVDEVTHAVMLSSRGGTEPVEVDLSGIAYLSGGGVRVLRGLLGHVPAVPPPVGAVTISALGGSLPQVELERAGIAHRVR